MTNEQRLKEIRERWSQATFPEQIFTAHVKQDIDVLLSLVDSQVAEDVTPLCAVHKSLDERDDERPELLNVLEPLANPDGTQDSITVLNNAIENAATSMRSACIEKVKELGQQWYAEAKKRGAAFSDKGRIAETIAKKLESVTIQEQEKQ